MDPAAEGWPSTIQHKKAGNAGHTMRTEKTCPEITNAVNNDAPQDDQQFYQVIGLMPAFLSRDPLTVTRGC